MKLQSVRTGFRVAIGIVCMLVFGALGYLYLHFSKYLAGEIPTTGSGQILSKLDLQRFENAEHKLSERQSLPYAPQNLSNPFEPFVSPPAPPTPPPPP